MKDVLCLATGRTYDLVLQTNVTAHPAVAPYPKVCPSYVIPIKKGGTLEYLYDVVSIVECRPEDVYKQEAYLNKIQFAALIEYHEQRIRHFGYGKANTDYRYYLLKINSSVIQPFEKKGVQVSVRLDLEDIPIKGRGL